MNQKIRQAVRTRKAQKTEEERVWSEMLMTEQLRTSTPKMAQAIHDFEMEEAAKMRARSESALKEITSRRLSLEPVPVEPVPLVNVAENKDVFGFVLDRNGVHHYVDVEPIVVAGKPVYLGCHAEDGALYIVKCAA